MIGEQMQKQNTFFLLHFPLNFYITVFLNSLRWVITMQTGAPRHHRILVSLVLGGICIAQSLKIPHEHTQADFDKIIRHLLDTRQARAIVLFAGDEDIRYVGVAPGHFGCPAYVSNSGYHYRLDVIQLHSINTSAGK